MSDLTKEAKAALEGVTPGPWRIDREGHLLNINSPNRLLLAAIWRCEGVEPEVHARFLAWCREGVPRLIEEMERLELHFNVPSCTNPICDCTEAQLHRAHKKVAALEAREQRIRAAIALWEKDDNPFYDEMTAILDAPLASEKEA